MFFRLEKAAVLLSSSGYSVEKIAQAVGYQNAVPIYQGIKEKFGCSPAEYRKTTVK
ncbi:helix-turn-helix domain-containing protein [Blautia producta]|uniref:helix-turn-helix domain-containing protein n=1 Tax=Blautia producta TaxID=33035 RepID=UPI001D02324B|nr:helix-turn-helix domain-containing protein [Blautia producta]